MAEASKGAGDLEIELDGAPYTLRPTLEACDRIAKIGGGLSAAVARCSNLDFDSICEVIGAGLGASSASQKKQIKELVYKAGIFSVAPSAIDFIHIVANGGRPPILDEEEDDKRPLDQAT